MLFQNNHITAVKLWQVNIMTLVFLCATASCKKFVQEEVPVTQVVSGNVFNSETSANAAIIGIYSQLSSSGFASGNNTSVSFISTLLADEMDDLAGDYSSFSTNSLAPSNIIASGLWISAYQIIYYCNSAIRGLENSKGLSDAGKNKLIGEAKFIRAFCYFYLTNYYGDIPLVLSPDFNDTKLLGRSSSSSIYDQVKTDLIDAQELLPDNYDVYAGERIRATRAAAGALLSRVYLYNGEWSNAEAAATNVLSSTDYSLNMNLDDVFLANSSESIWQLQPVGDNNTNEAIWAVIPPGTVSPSIGLRSDFVSAFAVEDLRLSHWIGNIVIDGVTYNYPYKYKIYTAGEPVTEYSMVLRLAEVYLIRAEARAMQDDVSGAQEDLNVIRSRAELDNTTATTKGELVTAIQAERRLELFTEWGHRWLDLIRWNKADDILGAIKLSSWQPTDKLFPIPQSELANGPNLTQNEGY